MIGRRRVVITGIGVLAANGIGKEAFWNSLLAGESGIGPVSRCDTTNLPALVAGEVKKFDINDYTPHHVKARRLSRNTQLAVAATFLALEDAGIRPESLKNHPLALNLGISMAGFDFIETEIRRIASKGNQHMLPTVIGCIHIASASTISELIGIPCLINVFSNSCVGGLDAVGKAAADIREGKTDIALAGGSDAPIETSLLAGFCASGLICTVYDTPQTASRPFDIHRTSGVIAEGSCIMVLEELSHALDRGAHPIAEITGYGAASDPGAVPAEGFEKSMETAIANASLHHADIDVICAHAPSDRQIDLAEANMICRVFANIATIPPVFSIKGATGNPLAAGGSMQIATAALALTHQTIPPTTNCTTPDPNCSLDIVTITPRRVHIGNALVNSHGIGNVNSSLVLKSL